MIQIHHISAGWLATAAFPRVPCHCLILQEGDQLALVDTGIGLKDVADPEGRMGKALIEAAGFTFNEQATAYRQIEALGFDPKNVKHIVLTHADPDHAGGVADFPDARVHLSNEEFENLKSGQPRYVSCQFDHGPQWQIAREDNARFLDLPARHLELGFSEEVLLVPLFGHTKGHCGVAIAQGENWFLHVGDAYYLKDELTHPDHPIGGLARMRADDNDARLDSLNKIRAIEQLEERVFMCGYHDLTELPHDRASR